MAGLQQIEHGRGLREVVNRKRAAAIGDPIQPRTAFVLHPLRFEAAGHPESDGRRQDAASRPVEHDLLRRREGQADGPKRGA